MPGCLPGLKSPLKPRGPRTPPVGNGCAPNARPRAQPTMLGAEPVLMLFASALFPWNLFPSPGIKPGILRRVHTKPPPGVVEHAIRPQGGTKETSGPRFSGPGKDLFTGPKSPTAPRIKWIIERVFFRRPKFPSGTYPGGSPKAPREISPPRQQHHPFPCPRCPGRRRNPSPGRPVFPRDLRPP